MLNHRRLSRHYTQGRIREIAGDEAYCAKWFERSWSAEDGKRSGPERDRDRANVLNLHLRVL